MEKPNPESFAVTAGDLETAKRIDERLPLVLFVASTIGWLVYAVAFGEIVFHPVILFFGLAIGFACILLTTLVALIPAEFLLRAIFPVYGKVKKYEKAYQSYRSWWLRTQNDFWQSLTGIQFEHELGRLYKRLGYKAEVTTASDDKGVDIWIDTGHGQEIVQCKAHKKPIGPSAVRELYGTLGHFGVHKGILASTSGFTRGAIETAQDKPIELLGLSQIISLQEKCQR